MSLYPAGCVVIGRAGWHQPPGRPGLTSSQECGVQGVGMKWIEERKGAPKAGCPGPLPPRGERRAFVWTLRGEEFEGSRLVEPLCRSPLPLWPLLVNADSQASAWRPDWGGTGISPGWSLPVSHRAGMRGDPQPGEPSGRALNLSQVPPAPLPPPPPPISLHPQAPGPLLPPPPCRAAEAGSLTLSRPCPLQ